MATVPTKASGDIFASLLGKEKDKESDSCRYYIVAHHEDLSTVISTCQQPGWTPLSAAVYSSKLLLFFRRATTGETVFRVARQCGCDVVGLCRVPVFSDVLATCYTVSTVDQCSNQGTTPLAPSALSYRPSIAVVRCTGKDSPHVSSIHGDFFLQLFGPEPRLSSSPILLIGTRNGNVLHCCMNELEYIDEKSILKILCSLEQPVVAVHLAQFPTEASATPSDPLLVQGGDKMNGEGEGANALLIVGQRGRIVVWRMGSPGQSFATYTEFHVPGPVLSSVLVPGHWLLHSTLRGCYKVCLRPQCMDGSRTHPVTPTNSPVVLPEAALRSPTVISPSVAFVVPPPESQPPSPTQTPPTGVLTVSPSGTVGWLAIGGEESTVDMGASQAAQELKQTLISIEATSRQVDTFKEKISSVDGKLTELNEALSLLCEVSSSRGTSHPSGQGCSGPFHCKLTPGFELAGVSGKRPCIDVRLSFQAGRKPLRTGWSLILQLHPGGYNQGAPLGGAGEDSSKVVPLRGMEGGRNLSVCVYLGSSSLKPLVCTLQCSAHYSTTALRLTDEQGEGSNPTGVSLVICTKDFDVLDFVEPNLSSSLTEQRELVCDEDVRSLLNGSGNLPAPHPHHQAALVHSLELPVPTTLCPPLANTSEPIVISLLYSLLPSLARDLRLTVSGHSAEAALRAYDGSLVCLRAGQQGVSSTLSLTVMASHRAILTEVSWSLQERLRLVGAERTCDRSHDQLCRQLHTLEVGVILTLPVSRKKWENWQFQYGSPE